MAMTSATTSGLTEAGLASPVAFGQISFINCLPVVLPIERGYLPFPGRPLYANPAELNSLYRDNKIDAGAMSSFYFIGAPGFTQLATVSISCDGEVGSVLLFSRLALSDLACARIAVPSSSATSVNLLRLMLIKECGRAPDFTVVDRPDIEDPDWDAALVIGDRAMLVDEGWSRRFRRVDLGAWWQAETGYPMVFGLWAARNTLLESQPETAHQFAQALASSAALGLSARLPEVIAEARQRTGLDERRLAHYFTRQLDFAFSDRHRCGLAAFAAMCRSHGLIG